jgi:hypothetical protein
MSGRGLRVDVRIAHTVAYLLRCPRSLRQARVTAGESPRWPGSRRGEYDVSSPTADPRTTIPGGGARRAKGAVNDLDCGDGRGIAGATTTTTMGGPGDDDVEAVGRFARAGRR